ncbi:hypothetical protein GCM10009836_27520 [Pseudonocardia ailaonensis]|uniref:Uncharacterized protein n=2 Tax=Pseudonocardia ailaonensis TaxID=367279 RepID=A0ABN2N033_9PSEU
MVAVPEIEGIGPPAQRRGGSASVPVARRRLVAVAVSPMELLRPESDLARLIAEAGEVDLLIARDERPACDPAALLPQVGVLPGGSPVVLPEDDREDWSDEQWEAWAEAEDDEDADPGDEEDGTTVAIAALGLRDLRVHRLGLPGRIGQTAADDLVAALSELVGFDPEPGVYCVAPLPSPSDPERTAVVAAARRVVQVYGLPMLRYRSLELSVVES